MKTALLACLILTFYTAYAHLTEDEHTHSASCSHVHVEEQPHVHLTDAPHAGHDDSAHPHDHEPDLAGEQLIVVQADARSRHILNMQIEEVPEISLALTGSVYGYLNVPPHAVETYALPCAGRISLHVKSAQQVKQGDVLYTLQSPALTEQLAGIQGARASLSRCEVEIEAMESRLERLASVGSRSGDLEEQLKFKRAEKEQLQQELSANEARLNSLTAGAARVERDGMVMLEVRAHADGTVRNVGVSQGSWGEQGAPVITMSNLSAMEIVATLYASDMPEISAVRAFIPVGRENVAVEGTWRIAEQPDPEKQTRPLYFTPDQLPEDVQAGKLCRLDLYAGKGTEGTVSIPDSAVVKVGVDDVVFVEVSEGQYAMVKVQAGASRRGMTPVNGLHPGQHIVVKGGYELKYILPSEGEKKKAGHFHADGKFHEGEH